MVCNVEIQTPKSERQIRLRNALAEMNLVDAILLVAADAHHLPCHVRRGVGAGELDRSNYYNKWIQNPTRPRPDRSSATATTHPAARSARDWQCQARLSAQSANLAKTMPCLRASRAETQT